jgi:hypothetical protein
MLRLSCVCVSRCSGPSVLDFNIFENSLSLLALLNRAISSLLVPAVIVHKSDQGLDKVSEPAPLTMALFNSETACLCFSVPSFSSEMSVPNCLMVTPNCATSHKAHLLASPKSSLRRDPPAVLLNASRFLLASSANLRSYMSTLVQKPKSQCGLLTSCNSLVMVIYSNAHSRCIPSCACCTRFACGTGWGSVVCGTVFGV